MKPIRKYIFGVILAMAMLAMTACGSSKNETTSPTTMAPTTMMPTTMAPTTTKATNSGNDMTKDSEGVIEGVIDDVEKGIDDLTGSTMAETTKAQ